MILKLKSDIAPDELNAVMRTAVEHEIEPKLYDRNGYLAVNVNGITLGSEEAAKLTGLQGVEGLAEIKSPYPFTSLEFREEPTVVDLGRGVSIGGQPICVIGGPCSIESAEQLMTTGEAVKSAGAGALRGGAFKPRTSPYAFQGLGLEGLKLLRKVGDKLDMPVVTEVVNTQELDLVANMADVLQVGARNCQNFPLLKALGRSGKPVLLKRGMMTKIEEVLMSAEYVISNGNPDVILCERGIRTFETDTRNTLDLSAVAVLKHKTHLPVVIDPSHATGHWGYVPSMSLAAVAAGADGLLIEVHSNPAEASCDGPQSLTPKNFADLMARLKPVAEAVGRTL